MQRSLQDLHPFPRSETITTFWHGNVGGATWSHRNVSSVTENGLADLTVTFETPYVATPAAIVTSGDGTAVHQGSFSSMTASSVRIITRNFSNNATAGRKTSLICVGEL